LSALGYTVVGAQFGIAQRSSSGEGRWVVATQQTVPQNYGGYIVPGSTLDQAIILVSQFNTFTGDPYNVQQFVVNLNR
jgi:hypothetical protein